MNENSSAGLPRPGPLGRTVRFVAGILLLGFLVFGIHYDPTRPLATPWNAPLLYLLLVFLFFHIPSILRYWRVQKAWTLQVAWLLAILTGTLADFFTHGTLWGPWVGMALMVPGLLFLAYLGLSFLSAALIASPG